MKRVISMALAMLLCLSLLSITAFASGESASLTGPGTVRAGDTIVLTLSLNGKGILGASGTLSYDSNQLTLVDTKAAIGAPWAVEFNGSKFVAYDNNLTNPINGSQALFTVTFKVGNVAPGASISVSCTDVTASDGAADANIGTVTYSATVAEPMSGDNSLTGLTVGNAAISPAFDPNVTSYTASVPFSVSRLDVTAAPANKATVSVYSPTLTPGGTTNVTVTVKAENGATKVYTIAVTREQDPNYVASDNNDLQDIAVEGFLLSPAFNAETTEYVVWLPYETDKLSVSGLVSDGKASVRVEGAENLVPGADNEVKLIVTAEDGTEKVYTIIAKRAPAHGSQETTAPETTIPETTKAPETTKTPETTAPAAPTEPAPGNGGNGGIQLWVLILACVLCLAAGAAAGIVIDKKLLNK